MNFAFRAMFAPAIISAYTTYGVISAARTLPPTESRISRLRGYLAGSIVGLAYGSYYVVTGERLNTFLFKDEV
jgi:hypothetical protein